MPPVSVSMDNIKVLSREQDWMRCKVKEAIHIKQTAPTWTESRGLGYQLQPTYGQIIPWSEPNNPTWPLRDHESCNHFTPSSKVSKIYQLSYWALELWITYSLLQYIVCWNGEHMVTERNWLLKCIEKNNLDNVKINHYSYILTWCANVFSCIIVNLLD